MSVQPYYADDQVSLYLGDCRELLPALGITPDSCVTDPPYGETSAAWDRWPDGWVDAVAAVLPASASLWCFGSTRMLLTHRDDFAAPAVRLQKRHQDEKPLLVLDCFAGSGTTGVAAKLLGRRALLIEADEQIAETAARRLAEDVLAVPL